MRRWFDDGVSDADSRKELRPVVDDEILKGEADDRIPSGNLLDGGKAVAADGDLALSRLDTSKVEPSVVVPEPIAVDPRAPARLRVDAVVGGDEPAFGKRPEVFRKVAGVGKSKFRRQFGAAR